MFTSSRSHTYNSVSAVKREKAPGGISVMPRLFSPREVVFEGYPDKSGKKARAGAARRRRRSRNIAPEPQAPETCRSRRRRKKKTNEKERGQDC
jgi:hypothetical protein